MSIECLVFLRTDPNLEEGNPDMQYHVTMLPVIRDPDNYLNLDPEVGFSFSLQMGRKKTNRVGMGDRSPKRNDAIIKENYFSSISDSIYSDIFI